MDFVKETGRLMIRPFNLSYLEEYAREFTAEITKYQFPDPFPDMETANCVISGFVDEMEAGRMLELVILGRDYELDVRNSPSVYLVEKFPFEKAKYEEITTESGKKLMLQTYHILYPFSERTGVNK